MFNLVRHFAWLVPIELLQEWHGLEILQNAIAFFQINRYSVLYHFLHP